ncbi:MAG: MBL fold metallo-hydrolase [Candidatus Howiella sp.]
MARFCPLFSGSKGNSTYIGCSGAGILIDAGVSCKAILSTLSARDIRPEEIGALLVTHEHIDHIAGLHAVAAKLHLPVYASGGTLAALEGLGKLRGLEVHELGANPLEIGGMTVSRFPTPHDCADSSGFVVQSPDGRRMAVATDMGCLTDEIRQALLGCDLVMIESNHDVMMLENGTYPYPLKRRILSDTGHLSNARCADFLPELVAAGTTRLVLAHLSRENNHPSVALETARSALTAGGFRETTDYLLSVAPPSGGKAILL